MEGEYSSMQSEEKRGMRRVLVVLWSMHFRRSVCARVG